MASRNNMALDECDFTTVRGVINIISVQPESNPYHLLEFQG